MDSMAPQMIEFSRYKELVKQIPYGKQLPDAVYVHESALDTLPREIGRILTLTIRDLELDTKEWNIVKFQKRDLKITLLNYPSFLTESYPALHNSILVNLDNLSLRESDYSKSDNPPILHRKETFLKPDHPSITLFSDITKEGEAIGLYENPKTIGFRKSWERLISRKGFTLVNGRLTPKASIEIEQEPIDENSEIKIDRHKTAINRDKLSLPMQLLARHNYFDGSFSILDYGCGKGDDVRELEAHGLDISAWDPVHRPDGNKQKVNIVNLGFVINVIEDRKERNQALKDAFNHATSILSVAAMIGGESITSQFKAFKDGIITSRNTFQKYFSQSELKSYIESTLGETAIAVSPGVFFVFKDKDEEQLFLVERQSIRRTWQHLTQRERRVTAPVPTKDIIEKHQQLFDDFWQTCLELGRLPANNEFEFSQQMRNAIGSHKKAFEALVNVYGDEDFISAQEAKRKDLMVYFALGLFERRKPYKHMPESLKRDIKNFFSSYKIAIEEATTLLFSLGKPDIIYKGCMAAKETLGCGVLDESHSYTFHSSLLNSLPPTLRVYVGCATQLYGDTENVDLIKIHIRSGKVTLMQYDDFNKKPIPELIERIKIKLREQDIDFFDYLGDYEPQPLYLKSQYLEPNSKEYKKQKEFDQQLLNLDLFDFSGFGPKKSEFYTILNDHKVTL